MSLEVVLYRFCIICSKNNKLDIANYPPLCGQIVVLSGNILH